MLKRKVWLMIEVEIEATTPEMLFKGYQMVRECSNVNGSSCSSAGYATLTQLACHVMGEVNHGH